MPLEHLTNCHGEWSIIAAMLGSLAPAIVWLKLKIFQSTPQAKD